MALNKNKTGIMAAISAAAEITPDTTERAHRSLPKGTIGSVRAGLGGIQDIDTSLIIGWGPKDRLELTAVNSDLETGDVQDLVESIRTNGQQVPVLLRPAKQRDGHFEVIYGRRRILACRELGQPVKALIRTLDDTEALMAKGLENASRVDLSFYERARFAEAILDQGHSRDHAMQALAISKNTLSQLERITRLVPAMVGDAIGAAPGAGRPKWMALATAFEAHKIKALDAMDLLSRLPADTSSDDRLAAVLASANKRGARQTRPTEQVITQGVTLSVKRNTMAWSFDRSSTDNRAFADWVERNSKDLINDLYRAYKKENPGKAEPS